MALLALAILVGLVGAAPACSRSNDPSGLEVMDAAAVRALAADGKPVLVSLWATWCDPCLEEMAPLSRFQAARPELIVLGLTTDDPAMAGVRARIDKILSERKPAYRQARLPPGGEEAFLASMGGEWDGTLPKLVVVMPDGRARIHSGAVDDHDLTTTIAPLLGGAW